MTIRAEDLTAADQSALRALLKALVMLARTPAISQAPVVPALPAPRVKGPRRR
jgi:hypothetical protein